MIKTEPPGSVLAPNAVFPPIDVFAPAKLNLALHVVGRRADGYHLIDSLVVFVSAGDTVEAVAAGAGRPSLIIEGPFAVGLAADEHNLVIRAERAFRGRFPALPPLSLQLVKRLPVSSGIGGGSADGAATLRLMARIAGASDDGVLFELACGLGADGPMCLRSAPLRARGIGEIVEDWTGLPPLDLVLVSPGIAVSTPAVFKRLVRADNPPLAAALPRCADTAALARFLAEETRNDLEAAAISEAPVVAEAKAVLAATSGCLLARMSGSGATVFGLYADAADAHRAAQAIQAKRPSWWVETARTIAPVEAMPRGPDGTV